MISLLSQFTLVEIVTVLVAFSLGVKGVITFFDWAWERLKGIFQDQIEDEQEIVQIKCTQEQHQLCLEKLQKQQDQMIKKLDMLIASDKDQLKADLTRQYHYFTKLGAIDDYSLDCIKREFKHYKSEGGNSFIEDLVGELKKLPKVSVEEIAK